MVQAPLDLNKITFPEHYKKVEKPSGQGEFLGKIILSRVIIDKSGEKAIIHYAICRDIANKNCGSRFLRFRKMRNEWVTEN